MLSYKRYTRLILDAACFIFSYLLAYLLRFDFHIPDQYLQVAKISLPWIVGCRFAGFWYFGLFKGIWRYTSVTDLISIIKATISSSLVIVAGVYLSHKFISFPRSVILLDLGILISLTGGIRILRRIMVEGYFISGGSGKRILIVGAGETGELLVRSLRKSDDKMNNPIAFVDDDQSKQKLRVHGLPVVGEIKNLPEVVEKYEIDEVVIAFSKTSGKQMREILSLCREVKMPVTMAANLYGGNGDAVSGGIRELTLEDVVGRAPVQFDEKLISGGLSGKVVMVTGAGGSIGSELCRQLIKYVPSELILLDRTELGIFNLMKEYDDSSYQQLMVPVIGDISDSLLLERLMAERRPQVIFHTAALKHVPLTEVNPQETIKNNVMGTACLADAACKWGIQKFVLLSTDKAANPINFMGVSKRLCELYVKALADIKQLRFLSVRFGNVLESSGSVVPIFKEQIRQRKPVTVTHPEATRYFISKSEAAQLVLQAAAFGEGGEIFVLDMGDPVKIVALARELIFLAGMEPGKDIEIKFTGLRPGEKVVEELVGHDEEIVQTPYEKIRLVEDRGMDLEKLTIGIRELEDILLKPWDRDALNAKLMELVPTYNPRTHEQPLFI